MECNRHEPVPFSDNPLDRLAGYVKCANCGIKGQYSNGRRKAGRSRKVIWFREPPTQEEGRE